MQFYNWSIISTFVPGAHDIFASYENRVSENTAFHYGDAFGAGNSVISKLMASYGDDIFKIISSNTLSDDDKSRKLSIIGLHFRLTQLDEEEIDLKKEFEKVGGNFSTEKKRFDDERREISNKINKLSNE